MSFTTENNENIVKDSAVSEETKSPGRLLAEERAERIRYAAEYRRKLEEEQAAAQQPKKTKAAEQKEREKLEKQAREQEEARAKLLADREESESRLLAAEEKLKELSANSEAQAPAETAENEKAPEINAEPAAETERIIINIPMRSYSVAAPAPTAYQPAPAAYQPAPAVSSYDELQAMSAAAAAPSAFAMPVTTLVAPLAETADAPEETAPVKAEAAAPVKAEPKSPATQVIDVTSIYRNDALTSPAISYGIAVTEGGWEHEIEDDDDYEDDIVIEELDYEPEAEDVLAEIEEEAKPAENEPAEEPETAGASVATAAAATAAVAATAGAAAVIAGAAQKKTETAAAAPAAEAPAPKKLSRKERKALAKQEKKELAKKEKEAQKAAKKAAKKGKSLEDKAPEKKKLIEKEDLISIYEQEPAANVSEAPAGDGTAEAEPYRIRESRNKKKGREENPKNPVTEDGTIPFDPRNRPQEENLNFDAADGYSTQYDRRQIENEHLRYLSKTKKLNKIKNRSARKNTEIDANYKKDGRLKKTLKSSAAVVKARMEYDSSFGSNDLAIETLKFYDEDYGADRENKKRRRKMLKIKRSASKAVRLEKKATKRYYMVLINEAEKPTKLKKVKNQGKLDKVLEDLEALISERERLDSRLKDLYRGAESKAGGRVRAKADKKRYKEAKRVHRSLRHANRQLNKLHAPHSLKTKIRYLFNAKIVSKSTLVYSKYLLKKLKPKGDAKRELKKDIKKAKKSLFHVGESLNRLLKSARNYDKANRRRSVLLVVLIILVIIGAALGVVWYFYGSTILAMLGLA